MVLFSFLVPFIAKCRAFKNQDMNSRASPVDTTWMVYDITQYMIIKVLQMFNYGNSSATSDYLFKKSSTDTLHYIPCSVIWNFFLLHKTTACNISWGLTWALKFLGFQSFLRSSPNLWTVRNIWSPGGLLIFL